VLQRLQTVLLSVNAQEILGCPGIRFKDTEAKPFKMFAKPNSASRESSIGPRVIGKNLIPICLKARSQALKCSRPRQCSPRQCLPRGRASGASIAMTLGRLRLAKEMISASEYSTKQLTFKPSFKTQAPVGRRGDPAKSRPNVFMIL